MKTDYNRDGCAIVGCDEPGQIVEGLLYTMPLPFCYFHAVMQMFGGFTWRSWG